MEPDTFQLAESITLGMFLGCVGWLVWTWIRMAITDRDELVADREQLVEDLERRLELTSRQTLNPKLGEVLMGTRPKGKVGPKPGPNLPPPPQGGSVAFGVDDVKLIPAGRRTGCAYCGGPGKPDRYGGCISCGAPVIIPANRWGTIHES